MKFLGLEVRRATAEKRDSIENPNVPVSADNFLAHFGLNGMNLPEVTIDSALTCMPVLAAVSFLSRTMATIPLHVYKPTERGPERLTGKLQVVLHENPNPTMAAPKFWQYFWQQVFTGGRGLAWIERKGREIEALWAFNPSHVTIKRRGFDLVYCQDGIEYPSEDVIDIPFMMKPNQLGSYGPIAMASKAIQLSLSMQEYGSKFFAGGGVPPLALVGPLPQGADATKRAMADIHRSIDAAKQTDKPIFPMPPGHDLKPVGFEPEKGQMTDARRLQVEEIARAYSLPPVFLQDLTQAKFANVEQQDLHLVKHTISQHTKYLEAELNLKLFGRFNGNRYVEHNLNGLLRGDIVARMNAFSQAIQTAQLTPDEVRAIENRTKYEGTGGDKLYIQGATVPLDKSGVQPEPKSAPVDDEANRNAMIAAVKAIPAPVINVDARTEVHPAKVTVSAPRVDVHAHIPRRGAVRKTVEKMTDDGQIVSMIEEEIEGAE
jgi:HK97 family phage portal protein